MTIQQLLAPIRKWVLPVLLRLASIVGIIMSLAGGLPSKYSTAVLVAGSAFLTFDHVITGVLDPTSSINVTPTAPIVHVIGQPATPPTPPTA